ncbi:PAQR family membrane homeostasis protein TrhA [Holophaga foetida]|uniref:PAQR family membrane homeostasis protein TrhA n=1 Tax=Holophaga foetida TaxID=35839 RepID=UPI0002473B1F|nr:hemolysin III family protein [Holophaga foetida]
MTNDSRLELANAMTHGLGSVLALGALVGMLLMAARRGTSWHIISVAVFGACLVLLYLMSTLYHASRNPRAKPFLRILDHSAIFLLIAGTYTPFCLVTLRGPWGWSILGANWGLAVLGVTLKALFGPRHPRLSLAIYLAMGWFMVVAIVPLLHALPRPGLLWLFGGGLCYTGGVVFYVWRSLRYNHAIWHLFVLAGSACHVAAVAGWVIPR